ncbi:plasmid stabilization protein [Rhizobium sp. 18055]|jgi:plasmid stability protein|uniref:FitA-like ribbon-helix-helix domain-containing protein n=1 Tax=Rhizobium sp. 18055 TaxID=2681403 RepID=UPI001356DD5F|nr:plasmid stabilization protein [Rhizobium sp. 18055]
MGDLLIRGLDDSLKLQLQERATRNGRSLSQEAIEVMRIQILRDQSLVPAGQRLRALIGDDRLTEDEVREISDLRREPDREPPRFDK